MSRFSNLMNRLQGYSALPCMAGEGWSCSYAELLLQVEDWRKRFLEWDVTPGSVVGLRAEHTPEASAALLALLSIRGIAALIPRNSDPLGYLADARASALLDFEAGRSNSWQRLPDAEPHPLLTKIRAAGEAGIVIFTSGSSGRPKAALQSVERFLWKFEKPRHRLRTLAFLLFDHIAGLDTQFYTLSGGGTLIVPRQRDPEAILRLIESQRVQVLPTSPSFLRLLCAAGDRIDCDVSSLQVITYGAEAMDARTLERVSARFPNTRIVQKYGTTETGSPRTVSRDNDSLWLSIKRDGVETRVVNGVLWIRSEGSMLGYLNAPSAIDGEGWYCTGDLVDVDGEWIRFRGRESDLINVGGEKVAPAEVERVLLEMDCVRDAVVCGEPHSMLGSIVTARVVLSTGAGAGDGKEAVKAIRGFCRERLPSYKVPMKIEIVLGSLANERQKAQRTSPRNG